MGVVQGAGVTVNFSDVTFFGGASGFDGSGNVAAPGSKTGTFVEYDDVRIVLNHPKLYDEHSLFASLRGGR